jgi:DUF971 family protein
VLLPADIQLIGRELAIRWEDGAETYVSIPDLRKASPSAEVRGEQDIFGQKYGGEEHKEHQDVNLVGWKKVGNYAVRFEFSDGHQTGIYSFDYLRALGEADGL